MKIRLKWLFDFYLFGNFHIALCAAALTHLSCKLFHLHPASDLLAISFLGTIAFYSFQRLIGVVRKEDYETRDERHRWNFRNKKTLAVLTFAPLLPCIWIFFTLHLQAQLILAATILLSGIYASPLFRVKGEWIRLRDFPVVKIFFVGLVWSAVTVWLPLANVFSVFGWNTIPGTITAATGWSIIMFLLIVGLTIPFDIRDLKSDPASIRSLPMITGEKTAVRIAQSCILASAAFFYLLSEYCLFYFSFVSMLAFSLWSALTIWILNDASSKKSEYYFSFVIDGMLILLWAFLAGHYFVQ